MPISQRDAKLYRRELTKAHALVADCWPEMRLRDPSDTSVTMKCQTRVSATVLRARRSERRRDCRENRAGTFAEADAIALTLRMAPEDDCVAVFQECALRAVT